MQYIILFCTLQNFTNCTPQKRQNETEDNFTNKKTKNNQEISNVNINDIQKNDITSYTYQITSDSELNESQLNLIAQKCIETLPHNIQSNVIKINIDMIVDQIVNSTMLQPENKTNNKDMLDEIVKNKNVKKNFVDFSDIAKNIKKPLYQYVAKNTKTSDTKYIKLKSQCKKQNWYATYNFVANETIESFDIAKGMPTSLKKHTENTNVFAIQTTKIANVLIKGKIEFKTFYKILDKKIECDVDDLNDIACLLDKQMCDFLQININKLTHILPKMQFFVSYYNLCQSKMIFFIDIKHIYMVKAMMNILQTILCSIDKATNEIKDVVNILGKLSKEKILSNPNNTRIAYYTLLKIEIEKMLLYILLPFIPSEDFSDLVNIHCIELMCILGYFQCYNDYFYLKKPNAHESAVLKMSNFCFLTFNVDKTAVDGKLETNTYKFFTYYNNMNRTAVFTLNRYSFINTNDCDIYINFLSIYILKNAHKLNKNMILTYNKLVAMYNYLKNKFEMSRYNKHYKQIKDLQQIQTKDIDCIFDLHASNDANQILVWENIKTIEYIEYRKDNLFYITAGYILYCICEFTAIKDPLAKFNLDIRRKEEEIIEEILHNMQSFDNWTGKYH